MKSNKLKNLRILMILFLILIMIFGFAKSCYSDTIVSDPDSYDPASNVQDSPTAVAKIKTILGTIQLVGVVVSVIVLIIIGIQFMLGSVEEKATYKERMMPYIVGAVLLFASTTLVNVVYNLANGVK